MGDNTSRKPNSRQFDAVAKLRAIIDRTGIKQAPLAEMLKTSQSNVSRWLQANPKYLPGGVNLLAIEEAFKLHFGDETPEPISFPRRPLLKTGDIKHLSLSNREPCKELGDFAATGYWAFPEEIQNAIPNVNGLVAIPVIGDSMEPTIAKGSTAFIDTTQTSPSAEDIYAIDYGAGVMVKRLQVIPRSNKIRVISDNRNVYNETFDLDTNEVKVHGRVIAWFHWRG